MSTAESVRRLFPAGSFGPPCTDLTLAKAARQLGHQVPAVLADFYRSFDGFTGPLNSQFLYPLLEPKNSMGTSLVKATTFLRSEDYFPAFLESVVALGDTGVGPCWLLEISAPSRLLWWDAEWGDDYEVVTGGLVEAWSRAKDKYEKLQRR